jgi:hypothetical protein
MLSTCRERKVYVCVCRTDGKPLDVDLIAQMADLWHRLVFVGEFKSGTQQPQTIISTLINFNSPNHSQFFDDFKQIFIHLEKPLKILFENSSNEQELLMSLHLSQHNEIQYFYLVIKRQQQ